MRYRMRLCSSARLRASAAGARCMTAPACGCHATSTRLSAVWCSSRGFYSGLDDTRVRRLRRSGMVANRPRGRDTLSLAYESRLRILPLLHPSNLYAPIDASLVVAPAQRDDPTSSYNEVEQRRAHRGHERMQRVVERKQKEEDAIRDKRKWRVLVVEPVLQHAVEEPVPYPSTHPLLYADWARVPGTNQPPAPSSSPPSFSSHTPEPILAFDHPSTYAMPTVTAGDSASLEQSAWYWSSRDRCRLRQNGDTTLLPGHVSQSVTLQLPQKTGSTAPHTITQEFFLALCVDPNLDFTRFQREEAQVELISAYRNILYEAAELPGGAADVIRVPALACDTCGDRFRDTLGKLTQQSVIKGFHRIGHEAKETLMLNRAFTLEVYVEPLFFAQFEKAFLESAWDVPTSIFNPGRVALYPGLAPPRTLLTYDGWVGKRKELVEAVETEGKSLLRGIPRGLDGRPIEVKEVFTEIRVMSAITERDERVALEHQTAVAEFGAAAVRPVLDTAPLHTGLEEENDEGVEGSRHTAETPEREGSPSVPSSSATTTTTQARSES